MKGDIGSRAPCPGRCQQPPEPSRARCGAGSAGRTPAGSGSPRRRCPVRRRARVSHSPGTTSSVVTAVATATLVAPGPPAAGQSSRSPPVPASPRGGPATRVAAAAPRPGPACPRGPAGPRGPLPLTYSSPELVPAAAAAAHGGTSHDPGSSSAPSLPQRR